MIFWRLLGWLFRMKPKALPPFEEAFLASFQKERRLRAKQIKIRDKEALDRRKKKEREEQKKLAREKKLEVEGARPRDIKRAFELLGVALAENNGVVIVLTRSELELNQLQFEAFRNPFVELCKKVGLKAHCNSRLISITWESALAYKDRVEKGTTQSIITSAYR